MKHRKRVYVGGTFDLFHPGHADLLRRAWLLGDVTVVLNSDDYTYELKGKRPIMDFIERAFVLYTCEYVDEVIYNDGNERTCLDVVEPDIIFYANDGHYTRESYLALFGLTEDQLDKMGIELIFAPRTEGVSSSDIIERILQRSGCKSCESCGTSQDAGQPDVPDEKAGSSLCACVGYSCGGTCEAQGTLPTSLLPCA